MASELSSTGMRVAMATWKHSARNIGPLVGTQAQIYAQDIRTTNLRMRRRSPGCLWMAFVRKGVYGQKACGTDGTCADARAVSLTPHLFASGI